MKTTSSFVQKLMPLAVLTLPIYAVAQEEPLTSLYSITGPYELSVNGEGLHGETAPQSIESVYIGGNVEKAYLYWGGRSTTPAATNADVTLHITGPGGFDSGVVDVAHDWFADLSLTPIRWNYRADITELLAGTSAAGDYNFEFGGWSSQLIGAGVQVVYSDGRVGNQKIELFGGFDYSYIGKPNEHGEIRAIQATIDPNASWAKISVMANDSHWDRTNNPREEEFWYKQGVGTLTGSSGDQVEIVNNARVSNWSSVSEDDRTISDPGATRHAKNFLEGVDGRDWDTYKTTLSLTPGVSNILTLDSQSTDESYSIPSITVVTPAGDTATDSEPIVYDVLETADGKFLAGGEFVTSHGLPRRNIVRLNYDGTVDETFAPGTGFNAPVRSIAVRPDGKILVGGDFSSFNGKFAYRVALLNSDGSLDETTDLASPEHNSVSWVGVLPDGRMLIAGNFRTIRDAGGDRERRIGIARLNADGSLDPFFTTASGTDGAGVDEVVVQDDGKILITGSFSRYRDIERNGVARLNSDGTLDTSFDPEEGASGGTMTGGILADGRLIFGGGFANFGGLDATGVTILDNSGARDEGFGSTALLVDEVRSLAVRPIPASGIPDIPADTGGGNSSTSTSVGGSLDDAEELPGGQMVTFSNTLELGLEDGTFPQDVGIRFEMDVPQGAVIRHATIQFTSDADSAGPALFKIGVVDSDDERKFNTRDFNITERELLPAMVDWEAPVWSVGDAGGAQRTPDLTALVQAIVSRPDWDSGNGIVFAISGSGLREAKAHEAGDSLAPVLNVRFESEGRVTDGLKVLYTFEEGSGTTVTDQSGSGSPLQLEVERPNDAGWGAGTLNFVNANRASNSEDDTKLMPASISDGEGNEVTANEITLEAWVTPANSSQGGPARIMSFSQDGSNRNFSLMQDGNTYEARLRTTFSGSNGDVDFTGGVAATELTHVAFTRREDGIATIYINGQPENTTYIGGDFSNWNGTYDFSVGNEFNIGNQWDERDYQGKLHLVAVFGRALSSDEILSNFNAGPRDGDAVNEAGGGSGITREVFANNGGGTQVGDLLNDPNYPNAPTTTSVIDRFASPVDEQDNFGQRIHGFVIPPADGNYTFAVAGDDNASLYLSSDEFPVAAENEYRIAYHTRFTTPEQYDKYSSQTTDSPVFLEGGKRYYIMALGKEGSQGDSLSVGWKKPGDSEIATIEGDYLEPYSVPDTTGSLTYERWEDIPGSAVTALYDDPDFPANPNVSSEVSSAEAPSNVGNDYGMRLHGYIVPSQSGEYRFAIAGDDNTELYLSTSEDPASASKIAGHEGWTPALDWDKYRSQQSELITLTAGDRYYVSAVGKEGGGGDNLAIGWYRVGNSTNFSVVSADNIAPWDGGVVGAGGDLNAVLAFEAEEGAFSGNLFNIGNDGNASGGQFVSAPGSGFPSTAEQAENYITYNFIVAEAGTYQVKVRTLSPSGSQNSFYVDIEGVTANDSRGHTYWTEIGSSWTDDFVSDRAGNGNPAQDPVSAYFAPGSVSVQMKVRERGTQLDKIELVRVSD